MAKQAQLKSVVRQHNQRGAATGEDITADQMFRMVGSNLESSYTRSLEVMERYEIRATTASIPILNANQSSIDTTIHDVSTLK